MPSLISMFAVCTVLPRIYEELLLLHMTWPTFRNLEIVCNKSLNKLSSVKQKCANLFLEEAPCGSILVGDPCRGGGTPL